jgi:hypothetical protein
VVREVLDEIEGRVRALLDDLGVLEESDHG